jgi:hypothetical protein
MFYTCSKALAGAGQLPFFKENFMACLVHGLAPHPLHYTATAGFPAQKLLRAVTSMMISQ